MIMMMDINTTNNRKNMNCSCIYRHFLFLLLLLLLLLFAAEKNECFVRAFHYRCKTTMRHNTVSRRMNFHSGRPSSRLFLVNSSSEDNDKDEENDKDDKIAKLEEQLRKLKEGKDIDIIDKPVKQEEEQDEMEEIPISMFLSEGWKDGDKDNINDDNTKEVEEGDATRGNVLKAIGAIIAVTLFSQIQIGQENLSKYSGTTKAGENPGLTSIDLGDVNRVKNSDL
mmetsp:Transcript_3792/g.4089  ORF Transcript_3792/g.4089 Transcript_3792/m.4089 type:complete len:225 (+) Transcript_3792:3-677(+)